MPAPPPSAGDRGALLYTARTMAVLSVVGVLRVLQRIALVVGALVLLVPVPLLGLASAAPGLETAVRAVLVVMSAGLALAAAPAIVPGIRSQRLAVLVRTGGIEVHG